MRHVENFVIVAFCTALWVLVFYLIDPTTNLIATGIGGFTGGLVGTYSYDLWRRRKNEP